RQPCRRLVLARVSERSAEAGVELRSRDLQAAAAQLDLLLLQSDIRLVVQRRANRVHEPKTRRRGRLGVKANRDSCRGEENKPPETMLSRHEMSSCSPVYTGVQVEKCHSYHRSRTWSRIQSRTKQSRLTGFCPRYIKPLPLQCLV